MEEQQLRDDVVEALIHDFKCPLSGIIGYSDLLLDSRIERSPAQQQECVRSIKRLARRLADHLDFVLRCSRDKAGGTTLHPTPFELDYLVTELRELFRPQLRPLQEMAFDIEPRICILGDRPLVREVFVNLLSNAVKFSGERGRIQVRAWADASRLLVQVADNGRGLPSGAGPRLYAKFSRMGSAEPGSGLGLFLAREILEAHGQSMVCHSIPGAGTTFTFSLPISSNNVHSGRLHPSIALAGA